MLVHDLDGDGDSDVVTSLAAHHFGLSWFEQVREGEGISFVEHRVMDDEPSDSAHGVRFAELHALDLGDVDGDGLADVITGKRWWSHSDTGDPEPGWHRGPWPMTVADVLRAGADGYTATVERWARSVRETLDTEWPRSRRDDP